MPLQPGARLGPYEIESALGAGGMGEVYRARDTRLDRIVAIKVLPDSLAGDAEFRARFDREARVISSLSHPHICALFDVGHQDSTAFLVMEHLDGQTLAARLANGPLTTTDALHIAIQVASALDAAHRAGIVHRDLKPGNVMLVRRGGPSGPPDAKLLDFGLAKMAAPAVPVAGSMAPTTPPGMTAQGTILGTFQYMAPEQVEGLEADARTDIFAFGAVLFEMLTGRPAFDGKTRASLLGAILKDEPPPISHFDPSVPPALDRIVAACVAKHPEDRWQTVRDLQRELMWTAEVAHSALRASHEVLGTAAAGNPVRPQVLPWALAGTLAATLGATLILLAPWRQAPAPAPMRFGILPATGPPFVPNTNDRQFDISSDGARIVYASGPSTSGGPLTIRALGELDSIPLPGITSGRAPFFSPDGEWIGFFDLETVELRKVPAKGGPAVTICRLSAAPRGAVWAPDDTIVFATSDPTTGLLSVAASGGEPVVLTKPDPAQDEAEHFFPSLLRDGRAVVFTVIGRATESAQGSVAVLDRATGTRTSLLRGSNARYVETGHLIYTAGPTLFAVPFDPVGLTVRGAPVPMVDAIGIAPTTGAAQYSVSSSGTLVFMPPSTTMTELRSPVWVDRAGQEAPIDAPPRTYYSGRLSPNGSRAVFDIREREDSDAWIWDFPRRTLTRLTFTPGIDFNPLWTPDGRTIVTGGTRGIFVRRADGTGAETRITSTSEGQAQQFPLSFTPDGTRLVVAETNVSVDLALLTLGPTPVRAPLVATPFQEIVAEISPDGRWVAYESNESGRFEVYVRPFPDVAGGRWQLSRGGGRKPAWARSGRELFYVDGSGAFTAVPIQTADTFTAGNPTTLFTTRYYSAVQARSYDVAADGRFLMLKDVPPARNASDSADIDILVVVNWFEELKRRVPVD